MSKNSVIYDSNEKGRKCKNGMTLPPTPTEASGKPVKKPSKKGK